MNTFTYTLTSLMAVIFLAALAYTVHPYAGLGVLVIGLVPLTWYILPLSSGISFHQQRKLAKYRRTTTREDRYTVAVDRSTGMTISRDGSTASIFIELAASPLETIAYTDDGTGIPNIPVPVIASELRQYDITVEAINVISYGYPTADDTPYSRAYKRSLHKNLTKLRTIIEVCIKLDTSLPAVYARQSEDEGPEQGMTRATHIAALRIRNKLTETGWHARIMSKDDISNYDNAVNERIGDVFDHEHRLDMGAGTNWVACYTTIQLKVNPAELDTTAKAFGIVRRITPGRTETETSMTTYIILIGDDKADTTAKGVKFKRMPGVQGDILSYLLPLAANPPIAISSPTITKAHFNEFDVPTSPAWGIGALIGETISEKQRRRVSLNVASSKGKVLYLAANPKLARNILSRLAAAGEKIIIEARGEEWDEWMVAVGSPRITTRRGNSDIVVIEKEGEVPARAGTLVIVLCQSVPAGARYSQQQLEGGIIRAITGNVYRDMRWTANREEQRWVL